MLHDIQHTRYLTEPLPIPSLSKRHKDCKYAEEHTF